MDFERYYRDNYENLFNDAGFLWELRDKAVKQPNYTRADIQQLDNRISAHLNALQTAPDLSWELAQDLLPNMQSGEIFVSSVLAFGSGIEEKVEQVLAVGLADEKAMRGLVSACGWMPGAAVYPHLKKLIRAENLKQKYLAIAICGVRREDPKAYLGQILEAPQSWEREELIARALRLCGELKRIDLMPVLLRAMNSEKKSISFWAHWSAALMGNSEALRGLECFVMEPGLYQKKAIEIAFLGIPVEDGRIWIKKLTELSGDLKSVIYATALLGDPFAIPWLVYQMSVPATSRLAGEAFSIITGLDLVKEQLAMEEVSPPLPLTDQDLEQSDEDAEQEFLPYPDARKIFAVQKTLPLVTGQRYFMGQIYDRSRLQTVYLEADQRKRALAALRISLQDRITPLLNCKNRYSFSL